MNNVPSAPGGAARPMGSGAAGGGMGSAPQSIAPGGSGAKADIARLLEAVIKYDASDLHLAVGRPPAVRVRGEMLCGAEPIPPPAAPLPMGRAAPPGAEGTLFIV